MIDSDLEEQPEWLLSFYELKKLRGSDVIYGVQSKRKGRFVERYFDQIYYLIMNLISTVKIPKNIVTARLMNRRYIDSLLKYEEREFDIGGIWSLVGFEQVPYPIQKLSHSKTTYTIQKKLSVMVNSITSFSSMPLIFIFYLGFCILGFSLIAVLLLIIQKILTPNITQGWTSLIISIWLSTGILTISIGTIGIYLFKSF